MKYIKKFENVNYIPEVGDYVIMKKSDYPHDKLVKFITTNIGRIEYIYKSENTIHVSYDNVPENIVDYFHSSLKFGHIIELFISSVLQHSKNKEDLKIIIDQNNYNL